jgi:hypothetical protein
MLGSLTAVASALLAGCSGTDGSTPQGTLVGGDGGNGGDGDGGTGTTTRPPTTGAQDVFEGVDYGITAPEEGGTLTTWTIENGSDRTWSVTVVSILTVEGDGTEATTGTSERTERVTVESGERVTVELHHDIASDAWSGLRFDFRDLERA